MGEEERKLEMANGNLQIMISISVDFNRLLLTSYEGVLPFRVL
jgi:hypothetical protein